MSTRLQLFLVLLCSVWVANAQEIKSDSVKKGVHWDRAFRVNLSYPIAFGNNAHAKTQMGAIGGGFGYDLVAYRNVHFGIGIERLIFNVTDKQLAGDFNNTNDTNLFGYFAYPVFDNRSLSVRVEVGGGYSSISEGTAPDDGMQNGYGIRAGFNAVYHPERTVSLYAGLTYLHNRYIVNTVPELTDFYSKAELLEISFGARIQFNHKRKNRHK